MRLSTGRSGLKRALDSVHTCSVISCSLYRYNSNVVNNKASREEL